MPSLSKAMEMDSASLKSHNATVIQTNNLNQNVFILYVCVCARACVLVNRLHASQ